MVLHRWSCALALVVMAVCWCAARAETACPPTGVYTHSLLLMRYDAVRDIRLVETVPFPTPCPCFTPQQYADALAARPEMDLTAAGQSCSWYRDPEAAVQGDTLLVNYRDTCTEQSMSSAESTRFWTRFASWFRVPGIRHVRFLANGEEVTFVGETMVEQPVMQETFLYLYNPTTGEVGLDWQFGEGFPTQATIDDAVRALRERTQSTASASTGFGPLLPAGMTFTLPEGATAHARCCRYLQISLSADFPLEDTGRLAGMVLLFTQFPEVNCVHFTREGRTIDKPFMRTNLARPVTAYDLTL